ncbi:hypothetical protein I4U23_011086 [Adineta vaga]|nr:hypothetical protein I4U23_011086 [Adineta vaga]
MYSYDKTLNDSSSNDLSTKYCHKTNNRQVNIESHQFVWLDPEFNRNNVINIENLRKIVDYTKVFEKSENCLEHIKQIQDTTTFLVSTRELAEELIPKIHHLKYILKIYIIYRLDNNQKCFSNYSKLCYNKENKEISYLLNDLSIDVNEYKRSERQIDFSEFEKIQRTTDNYSGSWWYGFIRVLVTLSYPTDTYLKLIEFLKVYYDGKLFELNLYRQLKTEFELFKSIHFEHQPIVKSYRGQTIHIDEIKSLQIASVFINPLLKSDDQFQNVLFEFELDIRQQASAPFANISSLSHFSEELEILFMIGCKFEIQDIYYDENENYWFIKMDLDYAYSPHEYILQIWNDYIEDNELNCLIDIGYIHSFIGVCYKIKRPMNKKLAIKHCNLAISYMKSANEKAIINYEKIYILNLLSTIYNCKRNISNDIQENASMNIVYLQLTIQEMLKYYSNYDYIIILRISELADLFILINNYDDALINYQNVINMYLQLSKIPFIRIIDIYEKIVNIYIKYKHNYHLGLHYQLLNLEYTIKYYTPYRNDSVGSINHKKNNIIIAYEKLSLIYIKLRQENLAYSNLIIAMKLCEEILQSSDTDVQNTIYEMGKINVNLANISVKLRQYHLVSEYLNNAIRICEGRSKLYDENIKIANIYVKLLNDYTKVQQYDLVDEYLSRL